jgi:hypothetical protein
LVQENIIILIISSLWTTNRNGPVVHIVMLYY